MLYQCYAGEVIQIHLLQNLIQKLSAVSVNTTIVLYLGWE